MCGISGILSQRIAKNEREWQLNKMLDTIVHRGPDFTGTWSDDFVSLGHQRLSIIDLSAEANQPFEYMDLQIIFNGEVYNYIELREELKKYGYNFRTSSDTEVVMAAFKEWGANCVTRFVGMWSFAIWNLTKKELFCSRDRFGIKPFYFLNDNEDFYFASEYKAFKVLPVFDRNLNYEQLKRGLAFGWASYNNQSYYKQIQILEAAHNLLIDNTGKITIQRYWDIEDTSHANYNFDIPNARKQFLDLFNESVKIHSRSDVKIGGCLSGGLDSSAIASSFCLQFPEVPFNTFTIYYQGKSNVDERPFATEVERKYPQILQHTLSPSHQDITDHFHQAMYHADVPLAGASYISQYFLMQLAAKNGVVVVLDGQGSDEYLAGYMHIFQRMLGENLSKLQIANFWNTLKNHKSLHEIGGNQFMQLILKSLYMGMFSENDVYLHEYNKHKTLFQENSATKSVDLSQFDASKPNQMLYHSIFTTSLPTLLHYEDRNSMAFSLESRVPFLDHRLVEFAFGLPFDQKVSNDAETKHILRKALKDVLPDSIANRQDKKGFVTPGEIEWLNGPLKFLFSEMDYNQFDWLSKKEIKKLLDEYQKGDLKNANLVWRLLSDNYWLKYIH